MSDETRAGVREQQREIDADRRRERLLWLVGLLALVPVAAIILIRQFLLGP